MVEAPVEVAAVLTAARALASGGHRANGIALLRDGAARFPEERDLRLRLGEQLLIGGNRDEGRGCLEASVAIAGQGRNHNDLSHWLILDASVHGDAAAYEETRRFLDNLAVSQVSETVTFLDVAWLFFQGRWNDPRLAGVDPGWVHDWVRFLQAWANFETDGDAEAALADAARLAGFVESRPMAELLEARVQLTLDEPLAVAQRVEGTLSDLESACRLDYQSCVWIPLAERLVGEALAEVDGRSADSRQMLARAAEHAPNTWIASPLTR
jgi:hypothetical protein